MIEHHNNRESFNAIVYSKWSFKKSIGFDIGIVSPQSDQMSDEESKREHSIICRLCKYTITSHDNSTIINGKHTHTYKNPDGYIYTLGCFTQAKGCKNVGEPTDEFTWFPGFCWLYAICSNCSSHLGWYYQSGDYSFYGLILNRLVENIH